MSDESKREYTQVRHAEGWVSASPLPSQEELQKFYAEMYYQAPQSSSYQEAYDADERRYKVWRFEVLLQGFCEQGLGAGKTFLDVGAGEGFLMDTAAKQGYDVYGVDFSSFGLQKFFPALVDRLDAGDVFQSLERYAAEGRRFDAVSAINVLEHVIDPDLLMARLRQILAPGGRLAITVPNDFSDMHALLQREGKLDREFWFAPPHHLHYFNCDNLPVFCRARGFDVVDAFTDFPVDVYLLHPGSNYCKTPEAGPDANRGRILHDLLIAKRGVEAFLALSRAQARVGIGRNITVMLTAR